jgi:hypothetical protein
VERVCSSVSENFLGLGSSYVIKVTYGEMEQWITWDKEFSEVTVDSPSVEKSPSEWRRRGSGDAQDYEHLELETFYFERSYARAEAKPEKQCKKHAPIIPLRTQGESKKVTAHAQPRSFGTLQMIVLIKTYHRVHRLLESI